MVLRLINDVLWRTRVGYLWMLPVILILWTLTALGFGAAGMGVSLSLVLAYVFGPVASVPTIGLREIRVLPVTNRNLWKATWVMAAVVVPAFLLFAQALAVTAVLVFKGSSTVLPETLLLSALYTVLYAGALLPVMPALGYASSHISSRRPKWPWILATTGSILIFVGGFGLPFLFRDAFPLTLGELTAPWIAALAVCLVLTVVAWTWTPQRAGSLRNPEAALPATRLSLSTRRDRSGSRFTGIWRMTFEHAVATLIATVLVTTGFLGYWAILGTGASLHAFLGNAGLLPFDTGFRVNPDGPSFMVGLFVFVAIAGPGLWNPLARQLKVLPLSVGAINRLFLVTPIGLWAWVWLVLALVHVPVTGTWPGQLRPDIFAALCGFSALGNAMSLRLKGAGQSVWLLGAFGAGSSIFGRFVARQPDRWVVLTLTVVGLAAFMIAALVNHRTLTRSTSSSKAYQRASQPFGFGAPTSPR